MMLVEFLTARYDEREAAARDAGEFHGMRWEPDPEKHSEWVISDKSGVVSTFGGEFVRAHIALNDPAYVLADIATKRRIVEMWREQTTDPSIDRDDQGWHVDLALERVVKVLALPFADHADYDPAWAPL